MKEFTIKSSKIEIIDITDKVKEIVNQSNVKEGVCIVYTPHATCSVMINENWDPNIMDDILEALDKLIPAGKWRHDKVDANGAAHIKASIIGPSETIPIKDGKLMLGQWQDIMLADFDGPRERKVLVKIIKG
jgi:secondary thiamine-phosphate synthase enzyme